MKFLLRSCFIADPADKPELHLRNFLWLQETGLGFETKEDAAVWSYIQEFVRAHNHVPEQSTIEAHYKRAGEDEVLDRLRTVGRLQPKTQGDFINRCEQKSEDRRLRIWSEVLKDAAQITQTGLTVKDERGKELLLKGVHQACRYVVDKAATIVAPTFGSRLSGEITADGKDFLAEYERVESDPLAGIGQFVGIEQMDETLKGAKKFELWLHAAFTGGLKSTLALNWMYTQAIYYRHDSVFFSLEMPYRQVRRILFAIHSIHEKFKAVRHKLGIQKDPETTVGLDYEDIRDGTLKPNEREFLFNYVVPDLADPANKYGKMHIEVADPDRSDITVQDIRSKAELLYSKAPFATVFVDHAGLLSSRHRYSSTTDRLNEVLRDLKRLAMNFNRGAGIAVVALFQINREGYKAALKRKEKTGQARYDLTHLSYANEAERSSDIVTASWVDDDLRSINRVQFQCLKARDMAPFPVFMGRVEWPSRRIFTCKDAAPGEQDMKPEEDDAAATLLEMMGAA